jgi:hypothetical protein
MSAPEPKSFEPKDPVQLAPPKDDPISLEELATANGKFSFVGDSSMSILVAF